MIDYAKKTWVDDQNQGTAITQSDLNRIDSAVQELVSRCRYVVECHTTTNVNEWSYVKYSDGYVIQWMDFYPGNVALTSGSYGLSYARTVDTTDLPKYPVSLTVTQGFGPDVSVVLRSSDTGDLYVACVPRGGWNSGTAVTSFVAFAASSMTLGHPHFVITVKGWWKVPDEVSAESTVEQ